VIKFKKIYLLVVIVLAVLFVLGIVTPVAAQELTEKERELEIVRSAIRALPDAFSVTEADRPAVMEANRLANNWLAKYDEKKLEICTLSGRLSVALSLLGVGDAQPALPATGGFSPIIPAVGLLSIFAGSIVFVIPRKRSH